MPQGNKDNLLSAEWINSVVEHVLNQVEELLDSLIDDGLLSSGYLPFEEKMTPKLERKLAEQAGAALSGMETMPQTTSDLQDQMGLQ